MIISQDSKYSFDRSIDWFDRSFIRNGHATSSWSISSSFLLSPAPLVILIVFSCLLSYRWNLSDDSGWFRSIYHLVCWGKYENTASFHQFFVYSGASAVRWFVLYISLVFPFPEIFIADSVLWPIRSIQNSFSVSHPIEVNCNDLLVLFYSLISLFLQIMTKDSKNSFDRSIDYDSPVIY